MSLLAEQIIHSHYNNYIGDTDMVVIWIGESLPIPKIKDKIHFYNNINTVGRS